MIVYLNGSDRAPAAEHVMFVTPAGDTRVRAGEADSSWVDAQNHPITQQVVFKHGKAEVDDVLGRYMIDTGLASRTQLFTPG